MRGTSAVGGEWVAAINALLTFAVAMGLALWRAFQA